MSRLAHGWARAVAPAIGLAVLLGAAGCSSGPPVSSAVGSGSSGSAMGAAGTAGSAVGAAGTAAPVPANGAELGAADFAAAIQRPGTIVLDVRTPAEFAVGHLPGARNIDVNAPDFLAQVTALPRDLPYAVYCRSGNRSATALGMLKQLGFTSTYHLGGGVNAWTASGRTVVTS